MATRTCRKAGARHKHPGDVETTPCSARGAEDRVKQAPGKRPEERMGLRDSAIQTRHRQSGGRSASRKNCKRKPPGGENLCRTPTKNHGATTTPKEKVREKMGGKLPSCRTSHPKREAGSQVETEEEERPKANSHSAHQELNHFQTSAKPQSPRRPGRCRIN